LLFSGLVGLANLLLSSESSINVDDGKQFGWLRISVNDGLRQSSSSDVLIGLRRAVLVGIAP
jgi:hypothetical protein